MKIKDIMTKKIEVVSPDTLLHQVAKKMQHSDCGSIIVAKGDRLIGIITDRDLALRCIAESHDPANTKAEQVMTKEIFYCHDSDEMEDVALKMSKNKVRRLPVLDKNNHLVGIVSLGDIASHSTNHHYTICGKVLGHICAVPKTMPSTEETASNG